MGLCQSEPEPKKAPAKSVATSSSASASFVPLRSPTQEERLAAKCTKIEHDDFVLGPGQQPFRYSACLYPGFAQTQRKNCQDSFMSLTLSTGPGKKNQPETLYRCLGIFDGHGATGHEVSQYLVEQLPLILERMLVSKKYSIVQRMLTEAFLEVNKKLNKESGIEVGMSGSTGTLVLLTSDTIYAANIGDSRAVLGYASAMEMREKSVHDSELDSENGEFEEETEELIDDAKFPTTDPQLSAPTGTIELVNATNPSASTTAAPSTNTEDGPTGSNGAGMSYIAEFDEQGGPLSRLESEVLPMNFAQIAKMKAAAGNKGTPLGVISTNSAVQTVSSLHSGGPSASPRINPPHPSIAIPAAADSPSSAPTKPNADGQTPLLRAVSDGSGSAAHHDRSISEDAAMGIMPLPDTPLVHAVSVSNTPNFGPLTSLSGPSAADASIISSSAPSTSSADSALQSAVNTQRSSSVSSNPQTAATVNKKKKKKKAKNASQEFADYYKSQFPRCSVKEITVNHNFKDVEEKRRIESKGGLVQQYRNMLGQPVGPFRVYDASTTGPGLAVSRSFGDAAAHKLGVIAEPSVIALEIKPEHQFLVIASDGVWDQMSNQEVVTRVYEAHGNDSVAEEIVMKCAERWISANFGLTDDISIIIVYFPTGRTLRAARRHQTIRAARALKANASSAAALS